MVTDRELLEAAAKAAGITLHPLSYKPAEGEGDGFIGFLTEPDQWRRGRFEPLKDDGDALRLAVKLRLHINVHDMQVEAMDQCQPYQIGRETFTNTLVRIEPTDGGEDPYAATRRAIVRAAAALGGLRNEALEGEQ